MIISRYCNSVFAGLPADQVARLQRIQNNAARLVMKTKNKTKQKQQQQQQQQQQQRQKKRKRDYTSPQRTSLVTCEIPLPE